jgi:hypothetical protein
MCPHYRKTPLAKSPAAPPEQSPDLNLPNDDLAPQQLLWIDEH